MRLHYARKCYHFLHGSNKCVFSYYVKAVNNLRCYSVGLILRYALQLSFDNIRTLCVLFITPHEWSIYIGACPLHAFWTMS